MASIHSRHVRREVGNVHEARRTTEGVRADNGGYRPVPSHGDLKPLHRYNQTGGTVYVDLVMALSPECGIPSYPEQLCTARLVLAPLGVLVIPQILPPLKLRTLLHRPMYQFLSISVGDEDARGEGAAGGRTKARKEQVEDRKYDNSPFAKSHMQAATCPSILGTLLMAF